MDNQRSPNSPAKPVRRHTIDLNTPSMMPRFDFILPSYRRDRRLSSITLTVLPETIIETVSANISLSSAGQNPSSSEVEDNRKG
jgi:hypothetical protein